MEVLVEVCQAVSDERKTKGIEQVTQATLLGGVLPTVLTILSDKELALYCVADKHLSQLHQLAQLTSKVSRVLLIYSRTQHSWYTPLYYY